MKVNTLFQGNILRRNKISSWRPATELQGYFQYLYSFKLSLCNIFRINGLYKITNFKWSKKPSHCYSSPCDWNRTSPDHVFTEVTWRKILFSPATRLPSDVQNMSSRKIVVNIMVSPFSNRRKSTLKMRVLENGSYSSFPMNAVLQKLSIHKIKTAIYRLTQTRRNPKITVKK